jgi:hypothetical protein
MKKLFYSLILMSFVSIAWAGAINLISGTDPVPVAISVASSLFLIGFFIGLFKFEIKAFGCTFVDGFAISDTTYAGEVASQFLVKAITGADTINGGHAYIKDGIKKKFTIPRFNANYEDFIQDRQAMPQSKGSFTVDGVALNPSDYMIYTEFNPRDFEDHWFATQLDAALIDRRLPYTVESVVVQEVMKRYAKYFNKLIWNADTTLTTIYKYFNGWLKNAKSASDINPVSSPTTLTTTNIQAEMLKAYNTIPVELRYDPNMKYFVSYGTWDLYEQSQINQTYKGVDTTQVGKDSFKGKKVVKIADFPDDTMLIAKGMSTPESNLWIGLNSISDEGLQVAKLRPEGELWFLKMLVKADVQIGWTSEAVYYGS